MVGQVPDARPYIAAMDVLVSASANESFGIVLVEALAQGVPVVAVADAGPREIIDPGVTRLLVPRPSPPLLAAATGKLLADQPRRLRMAAAARRAPLERFGIPAMVGTPETRLRALATNGAAAQSRVATTMKPTGCDRRPAESGRCGRAFPRHG